MKKIGLFMALLGITGVLFNSTMAYSAESVSEDSFISENIVLNENAGGATEKSVIGEDDSVSSIVIVSEDGINIDTVDIEDGLDEMVSENDINEIVSEAAGDTYDPNALQLYSSNEKIEDMPINLQNGQTYTIDDFSEDYIAFFFGRGACGNTNTMTRIAESACASGKSIKIIMMDVDQEDDNVASFQEKHPYTMVSYVPGSFTNNNWMWRMIEKYDLNNGNRSNVTLPCTVIFNQKHELVFGSVGCKDEELTDFFGVVWIESLSIVDDGIQFLHTGESKELTAVITPDSATDRRIEWSSSNESAITVDENGKITAIAEGASRITVKSVGYKPMYSTCSASIDFYVDNSIIPVTGLTLDKTDCTIAVGKTVALTPVVTPDNATYKGVSWKSEDTSVAKVDMNGVVTGVSEGTTTITASHGIFKASCTVKVGKKGDEGDSGENGEVLSANRIVKEKISLSKLFGKSYKKYTISPKGYASISDKKILTIKKPGKIIITAYIKNGNQWIKSAKAEINAEQPVFSQKLIEATKAGVSINSADMISGTSIKPDTWTSSKPTVAKVDQLTGKVETVGKGSAKITAVYGSGKNAAKYSYTVKVKIPALSKKKANMFTGSALKLKIKNTSLTPVWSSSDDKIAAVDQLGRISALNTGNVVITATIEEVGYGCLITVKAPKINKSEVSIKTGKKVKLTLKNTKLRNIHWRSSDENIAYVDETGMVYGMNPGMAMVSTDTGGVVNSCLVTVD